MRGLSHSVNLKRVETKCVWSVSRYSSEGTVVNRKKPQDGVYPVEIRTGNFSNTSQKHQCSQVAC